MRIKMTRRLIDKKAVKLSFNESSDEQDFNCNWDLNVSSDEDIFLKGKSGILWSRTRDLFDSPDSYESFSDFTGRTISSCSWHNDEFDMKSSSKVNASLEAIDNALYEKVKSPLLNETVYQECCDWAERFPYFRIKGQQITTSATDSFVSYSTNSANIKHFNLGSSTPSLHLEGKKLPLYATNKSKGMSDNIGDNKVLTSFEEIIDDDNEEYEEYFAVHTSDQPSDSMQVPINDSSKANAALKLLQDKVIEKLVSEMWPSVLTFLEKLDHKSSINNDLQLPPITVANDQKRVLSLKRPKTEGSGIFSTEFPKLESILTVSPKVLQKRELGCISRVARPNSEMSVNSRVPSKSMKSIYPFSNSVHISSECQFLKSSRGDRESENLCLVLPALEEDFQDSSNVLRGFHIEPSRKDSLNKSVQSSRNEYDISNPPRESDYFLPPIQDKNYVPSNVKLTKNLFTFYGSPVICDKSKHPGSARYKKTNSRPNTSVSKKIIKSHEVNRQVPVNSGLYITAKGVNKNSSNIYTERNSEVSLVDTETIEENQEKSVTLFPIVTSLIPNEDKNNSSGVKKGLLHTFLGGKKR